jgi:antitoxin (DNA-binding transcriptional repressor) of toxin-antitoxin stability system
MSRDRRSQREQLTASQLRADVYRVLDRVLESGVPAEIKRKGRVLRIVPETLPSRLSRLVTRPTFIKGDPDDLVHLDWSAEWRP